MRGRYQMMDWELQKWKQELSAVIARLSQNKSYQEDFTHLDVCPANIEKALEIWAGNVMSKMKMAGRMIVGFTFLIMIMILC